MRPAQRTKIVTVVAAILATTATVSATHQDDTTAVAASEPAPATYPPAPLADPVPTRHAPHAASLAVSVPRPVAHKAKPKVIHKTVKRKVVRTTAHRNWTGSGTPGKPGYGWNFVNWSQFPSWAVSLVKCFNHHEAWNWPVSHKGQSIFDAENPTSSASGFVQMIDGTWRHYRTLAHAGTASHASDASPTNQAKAAIYAVTHGGIGNWKGTHCGYGT
jgi:hypothetical protein